LQRISSSMHLKARIPPSPWSSCSSMCACDV
jgi:hypothetical protein